MSIVQLLLEPFRFDFMVNALLIAMVIAVPMALLSCYLVLKGWALLGDAIAHAVFPGVVIAYLLNLPFALGAFVAGLFCATSTGYLQNNSRLKQDTVMGVVYAGMFGLGLVLYVKVQADVHLDHILFGDILGANAQDILASAAIAVLIAGVLALKWKDFMLHTFDPVQASAIGLRVGLLHYGLLCMITLAVVGALKAAGIILAIALLISPGAIAALLTRRFGAMLWVATAVSVGSAFLGVYLSFFIDSAPAPTIVLVLAVQFIVALLCTSRMQRGQSSAPGLDQTNGSSG